MLTDTKPLAETQVEQLSRAGTVLRRPLIMLTMLFWPAAALVAAGVPPASEENGVDEFVYVGVVERLGDYIGRWPSSYYPYRFGYILPEWLAERALGATGGYLTLRLSVLGLIAIIIWKQGGRQLVPALAGSALLIFSPILQRGVFDTYVDSTGVLFLLVGALLLASLRPERGQWWIAALAGASLTLSWNSQFVILPLVVVICVVLAIDWLVEFRTTAIRELVASAGAIAAVTAIILAAAAVVYFQRFGVWDILSPNLFQASRQTEAVYIDQGVQFLAWRHYLLVAPLALGATLIAWRAEPDVAMRRSIRRMALFALASMMVFGWFQWALDTPLISVFLYSVYPLCLCLAAMATALTAVSRRVAPSKQWLAAVATVGIYLMFLGGGLSVGDQYRAVIAFVAVCLMAAVLLAVRSPRRFGPLGTWLPLLPLIGATGLVTVSSPHVFWGDPAVAQWNPRYDKLVFSYDHSGLETYDIARQFARSLPVLSDERGEVRVWFDGSGPTHAATSTLLHFTSSLQLPGREGVPEMTDFVPQRLANDRPRYVVLLDTDDADIDAGASAIAELGEPYVMRWRRELRSGSQHVNVALLERSEGWRDYPCHDPAGAPFPC